jgi:hypothetical protein
MHTTLRRWIERVFGGQHEELWHECEICGDIDSNTTHAPLSTGEVVCWHCAERAGEFEVPYEMEWRISDFN